MGVVGCDGAEVQVWQLGRVVGGARALGWWGGRVDHL